MTTNTNVAAPTMNYRINRMAQALLNVGIMEDIVELIQRPAVKAKKAVKGKAGYVAKDGTRVEAIETTPFVPGRKGGFPTPDMYVFGLDEKIDMKIYLSCLQTVYASVLGAGIREADGMGNIFEQAMEAHNTRESTSEMADRAITTGAPMTYAEARYWAAIVYQCALSCSRHDRNGWARGFTVRTVETDAHGKDFTSAENITPLQTFDEYLITQKATTPKDDPWYLSAVRATELNLSVPHFVDARGWDLENPLEFDEEEYGDAEDAGSHDASRFHVEIHHAQELFLTWFHATPWTRDDVAVPRIERIIGRMADKRWETLKSAIMTNAPAKAIDKAIGEWNLMVHSPKMEADCLAYMNTAAYIDYKDDMETEALEEKLAQVEFMEDRAHRMETRRKVNQALEERMARLEGKATVSTPSCENANPNKGQQVSTARREAQGRAPTTHTQRGATGMNARTFGIR